jgi:triacylglycerol lipase
MKVLASSHVGSANASPASAKLASTKSASTKSSQPHAFQTVGYCDRTAGQLAELAHLAYDSPDQIALQVRQLGFAKFIFFSQGNTQAFLAGNATDIILAFRGSEPLSLGDWLSDADCQRMKACGGRVHAGFWQDWQSIWATVETQLSQIYGSGSGGAAGGQRDRRFWLTGHSLGGALATLAGIQLQMCGYGVNGIYTFGTPRVGDRSFALQFNRRLYQHTFRLVNHKDVVPHLPPLGLGYAHVGQLIYFDRDGQRQPYPGKDDDNVALTESLIDHDMAAYRRCIQRR